MVISLNNNNLFIGILKIMITFQVGMIIAIKYLKHYIPMKKLITLLSLIVICYNSSYGQTPFNPYVNNILFTPAPTAQGFPCNSVQTVQFTQGLSTVANAINWQTNPLSIIICVTGFTLNGATPSAIVSGTYASKFNWAFDSFAPNCLIGTQNQTLPGIGSGTTPNPASSGTIIVSVKVPPTASTNTSLGVNVNLQPPGYMSQFNNSLDDNKSIQTIANCSASNTVNLTAFIEAYVNPNLLPTVKMRPVLLNQNVAGATQNDCDKITVELHKNVSPYNLIASTIANLNVNGLASAVFMPAVANGQYYLVIKHRNSIETWSAAPITISSTAAATYNFSSGIGQAYGSNMVQISTTGKYALFSGDIVKLGGMIDNADYSIWETDTNNFSTGFVASDFDGDGATGNADYGFWETNSGNFVSIVQP
jgi:hypothetical protein